MFFKKTLKAIKVTGAVFFFTHLFSCSVGERREQKGPIDIEKQNARPNAQNLGCLKGFSNRIQNIINGKLDASARLIEIETLKQCTTLALTEFTKLTQGKNKNEFTPREIRDFLQKFYLNHENEKTSTISDALLDSFVKIKVHFFGGEAQRLTTDDMVLTLRLSRVFFDSLRDLNSFFPIQKKTLLEKTESELDHFHQNLNSIVSQFSNLMNADPQKNESYQLRDFLEFIQEIEKSISPFKEMMPNLFTESGEVENDVIFLKEIQDLFFPAKQIPKEKLKESLLSAIDFGMLYLKINSILAHENLFSLTEQSRDSLYKNVSQVLNELQKIIERHEIETGKGLEISKIENSIYHFLDLPLAKNIRLQKQSLIPIFHSFLGRFVGKENHEDRLKTYLDQKSLGSFKEMLDEWLLLKVWVDTNRTSISTRKSFSVTSVLREERIEEKLPFPIDPIKRNHLIAFQDMLKNAAPMYNQDQKAYVYSGLKNAPFTLYELNIHCLLRPFLHSLINGYDEKSSPLSFQLQQSTGKGTGLTLSEFERFVRDIWGVLIDIKFLSRFNLPEEDSVKRFREASLFTMNADGDSFLSLNESASLVLHLAEAKSLSMKMTEYAQKKCATAGGGEGSSGQIDEFGHLKIEPQCYREQVLNFEASEEGPSIWSDFPNLIKYYRSLSSEEKVEFRTLVEVPGRKRGYQEKVWFETTDTETIAALIRYVETLIERFDQNVVNGTLDAVEAKQAFPIFKSELKKYKPDLSDDMLYAAFSWMLKHGAEPVNDGMDFFSKATGYSQFLWWKLRGDENWKFEGTRRNIMSVFGMISQSGQKNASRRVTP